MIPLALIRNALRSARYHAEPPARVSEGMSALHLYGTTGRRVLALPANERVRAVSPAGPVTQRSHHSHERQ